VDNFESKNDILSENMTEEQPATEYVPYGWQPPYYNPYEIQEQYFEKQWVRRIGNSVGFPLSMFIILGNALALILQYFIIEIFGLSKAIEIFSNPDILYLQSACFTVFLLTVPYLFTINRVNLKPSEFLPFKKVDSSKSIALIMVGMGVCAISNYATAVLASFLEQTFGFTVESGNVDYGSGPKSFILMLLCVGLLPALLEEIAFRKCVLGTLQKYGNGTAIVVSALLFGVLHGGIAQSVFAFIMGLTFGLITVKTGNIRIAVAVHLVNNALSVLSEYVTLGADKTAQGLAYTMVVGVTGICGVTALIISGVRRNALLTKTPHTVSEHGALGVMWSAPLMVIAIIVLALRMLYINVL
jgi:membrane protease YdiL (CAAX protease family)